MGPAGRLKKYCIIKWLLLTTFEPVILRIFFHENLKGNIPRTVGSGPDN